jgi:hypothetical protein
MEKSSSVGFMMSLLSLQSAACCVKRLEHQLLIEWFSQVGHGARLRRHLLPMLVILAVMKMTG